MSFEQETNLTKIGIEDFEIKLFSPGPSNANDPQIGVLEFQVLMSNSTIQARERNDLLERLEDDATGLIHRANLISLRDYIRTRLNVEVLP